MDQHAFHCDVGISYSSQRRRIRDTVSACMHQIMYDCGGMNNVDTDNCVSEISDWQSRLPVTYVSDLHIIGHDCVHVDIEQPEGLQLGFPSAAGGDANNHSVGSSNVSLDDIDLCESDSKLESVDSEISDDVSFQTKLAVWAVDNIITHCALRDLLAILRFSHPGLPVDPRTLLKTPRNYYTKDMATNQGQYFHFGLVDGIRTIAMSVSVPANVELQFNFDGLPRYIQIVFL